MKRVGRSEVSAITQTPASGPFVLVTTPVTVSAATAGAEAAKVVPAVMPQVMATRAGTVHFERRRVMWRSLWVLDETLANARINQPARADYGGNGCPDLKSLSFGGFYLAAAKATPCAANASCASFCKDL